MAAAESLQAVQQQPDLVTRKNTVYANSPRIAENTIVVELPHDLRTNALVQMLGLPEEEKDGGHYIKSKLHEVTGFTTLVPTFAVIAVSGLQLLMAWATFNYVRNNMILTLRNPLLTSYEMYVGSNQTLPKGLVDSLCGQYDDQVMEVGRNGPLNHISMPDGSVYKPSDEYDMFYNIKSPFRVFNYAKLGIDDRSVLDNTLYVIHEGLTFNPLGDGAGYSCLFILMMAMWLFAVLIEFRTIFHNSTVLLHFKNDPAAEHNFELNETEDKYKLVKMTTKAYLVLFFNIFSRFLVAVALLITGCFLIVYTTNKMDLILNALALLFVLEISSIFFFASVSGVHQRHIQDIEPVVIELPRNSLSLVVATIASYAMPALPFAINFLAAACLRLYQLRIFRAYMRVTAAMCLFAGPTPGGEGGLVAPVTGFCDTLLSIRCAPDVSPKSTLQAHGRCVISDQGVGKRGTTFLYMDDERIFEGRGKSKSWASWGSGMPELYERGLWSVGPYQDIMRKNCLQMYQKTGVLEDRMVDPPTKELMYGAPFYCSKDAVWKAVFGKFTEGVGAATDITMESMEQVADLRDPAVVAAIDACQSETPVVGPHAGLLSTHEKVNAHGGEGGKGSKISFQRKGGSRQKKLGAAGTLSIPRRHKQSEESSAGDNSKQSSK
mmetsp:Transcript_58138/g.109567  ORF Transcript_58138/g.109567 Transcript_58138/m.109567 type:complete len:662 (+) Transcript_58138:86-2071(+)